MSGNFFSVRSITFLRSINYIRYKIITYFTLHNNISEENPNYKHKTTNVNILLNRVRYEKKNSLKKKLVFVSMIVAIISVITFIAFI